MDTNQIMSAIFLIAVLILILPNFLSTNKKLKEFLRNLSIWAIITLVIIVSQAQDPREQAARQPRQVERGPWEMD